MRRWLQLLFLLLLAASACAHAPAPLRILTSPVGAFVPTNEVRYVYDGHLVVQERHFNPQVSTNHPHQVVTYTRGLDLSGSMQGAGGIGGLLARTASDPAPFVSESTSYYHSDGNGNVTALVNSNQYVVARYAYDPFGSLLMAMGPQAAANAYRFSSKEYHALSGLYSYGRRFYDPSLQRWVNRDPLGEKGGINLYGFAGNNPANDVDPDGRRDLTAAEARIAQRLARVFGEATRQGNKGVADQLGSLRADFLTRIGRSPNAAADPIDLRVAVAALKLWDSDPGNQWGEGIWDSKDYQSTNWEYPTIPASQYKCNVFVAQSYYDALGVSIPYIKNRGGTFFPPQARQWGNPNNAIYGRIRGELAGRFGVVGTENLRLGDIIPAGGHVGIYLGHKLYISARDNANGVITGEGLQHAHGIQIKEAPTPDLARRWQPN
jgi:RHS repeat-associated protein